MLLGVCEYSNNVELNRIVNIHIIQFANRISTVKFFEYLVYSVYSVLCCILHALWSPLCLVLHERVPHFIVFGAKGTPSSLWFGCPAPGDWIQSRILALQALLPYVLPPCGPDAGICHTVPEHRSPQNSAVSNRAAVVTRFVQVNRTDRDDNMTWREGTATKLIGKCENRCEDRAN